MKYESAFGLGEIVVTKQIERGCKVIPDLIGEVIGCTFDKDSIAVHVRLGNGCVQLFRECELVGDPEFDQTAGKYAF